MERSVERALSKRIKTEWRYKPNIDDLEEEYGLYVKAIVDALKSGNMVGFSKPINTGALNLYSIDSSTSADINKLTTFAEKIMVLNANLYGNTEYELLVLNPKGKKIYYPLRPDVNS